MNLGESQTKDEVKWNSPSEEEMEKQKFQITEKQARELFRCVDMDNKQAFIERSIQHMKEKGYIRKSELQTLVEEAEEIIFDYINCRKGMVMTTDFMIKINNAFQALIKENESLKS